MEVVDAAGVTEANFGLQDRCQVGIAQRADQTCQDSHSQCATRAHHQICGRANRDSTGQRCILDVHLRACADTPSATGQLCVHSSWMRQCCIQLGGICSFAYVPVTSALLTNKSCLSLNMHSHSLQEWCTGLYRSDCAVPVLWVGHICSTVTGGETLLQEDRKTGQETDAVLRSQNSGVQRTEGVCRTMSNFSPTKADAMNVTTVAPSSETTVLMMQLNCWKGPGDIVPGTCPYHKHGPSKFARAC